MRDAYLWLHMPEERDEAWPVRILEQQFALKRGRDIHYTEGYAIKAGLAPADMPGLYNLWDVLLYLSGGEGFGLPAWEAIYAIKAGLAPADMPALYNLGDALLYLSGGEGFGLPAWEAMCCELPVIYTNYSSHGEFLGLANAGLPVGGVVQPERETCIWRMIADEAQVIEAVRSLYFDGALRARLGANGRAFAKRYALEVQAERWHHTFQRVVGGNEKQRLFQMERTVGAGMGAE